MIIQSTNNPLILKIDVMDYKTNHENIDTLNNLLSFVVDNLSFYTIVTKVKETHEVILNANPDHGGWSHNHYCIFFETDADLIHFKLKYSEYIQ